VLVHNIFASRGGYIRAMIVKRGIFQARNLQSICVVLYLTVFAQETATAQFSV